MYAFKPHHHLKILAAMLSDNDTDMSNATILDCPEISNATEDFLRSFAFWTEGIFLCGIGFPGK